MEQILDLCGQERFDGHGAVILYLNKTSIRSMERDMGRRLASKFSAWFNAYMVQAIDGQTITVGRRTRRIWRKS